MLDKPSGISSFSALGQLKKNISTKKVGHAGTLDPFATGLLLAVSGKLTKAVSLLSGMDKSYEAVFRFGAETDTLDTEGSLIAEAPIPDISAIRRASDFFNGDIIQVPPVFSAIKINGERAYSRARKGDETQMPERTVHIHEFEIISWNAPDLRVHIHCSKGTYIRSIARDLGIGAGSRAFCLSLRRTSIGPFSVDNAVAAKDICLDDGINPADFFNMLGINSQVVSLRTAERMRLGFPVSRLDESITLNSPLTFFKDTEGVPAALLNRENNKIGYRIVFDSPGR